MILHVFQRVSQRVGPEFFLPNCAERNDQWAVEIFRNSYF